MMHGWSLVSGAEPMYINSESILSPHVARALPQACEDNSSFGLCVKGTWVTVLDANTKTYNIYIYIYKDSLTEPQGREMVSMFHWSGTSQTLEDLSPPVAQAATGCNFSRKPVSSMISVYSAVVNIGSHTSFAASVKTSWKSPALGRHLWCWLR